LDCSFNKVFLCFKKIYMILISFLLVVNTN
jgi:hypothetical protein